MGVWGVLLVTAILFGRQTAARPVCRSYAENLALALEQVRIDGAPVSSNDAGLYSLDGGFLVAVSEAVVVSPKVQDPLVDPPDNCAVTTSVIDLSMIDPFTGQLMGLELRRAP